MRKHARHFLIIAAVAVLAFAFSGCVFISSQSSTQLNGIGGVQITTTAHGNGSGSEQVQLLIAYRIPTNASAPDAFTTANTSVGGPITFSQSSSFNSQLQSKSAPPSGQRWVGYISPTISAPATDQSFTVSPTFALQQGADGSPFQGPFNYRPIVGFRNVNNTTYPASRPVVCGSPITGNADSTTCATDPSSTSTIATNVQQQTQDLGVLEAPGVQSVNQGNVARVKYQAAYAGDGNPAPTFDLSATTNIPDATALPSTPTLTPDEGSTQLRVITRVPVDTPPGNYDVTLVASLPNGETRSSTHEVLVTPTTVRCDAAAPTIAGTRGDDVLIGTRGPDVIAGYAGDDEVLGLNGDDLICTGKGDDTIRGGGGDDQIAGRRGNDLLTGGSGHNVIDPGPGKDRFIQ
jgi:Ca2+-binding RTX toxin-like protein